MDDGGGYQPKHSTLTPTEICISFEVDPVVGREESEITAWQQRYGLNCLESETVEPIYQKLMSHFLDPMILLLLGSALISVMIGHTEDSISIVVTIFIVVSLAFYQEYESEKSLAALNLLAPPECNVLRYDWLIQEAESLLYCQQIS